MSRCVVPDPLCELDFWEAASGLLSEEGTVNLLFFRSQYLVVCVLRITYHRCHACLEGAGIPYHCEVQ